MEYPKPYTNLRIRGDKTLIVILTCFFVFGWALPSFAQENRSATTTETAASSTATPVFAAGQEGIYERGQVVSVRQGTKTDTAGGEQVEIYGIRFLSGPLNGETRNVENSVQENPYGLKPAIGNSVVLFMQQADEAGSWHVYIDSYDRRAAMLWLFAAFFITLILLSGWQGMKVGMSIVISIFVIGFVLIPLFIKGVNPVPVAIILMGLLTYLASGLSGGWNKKALVTALGTMGGALAGYLLSIIFVQWAHVSGLSTEEDRQFFLSNPMLNPRGLLFAGIIIAAAGAAEDVAVSIASAASEIKRAKPHASFKEVFSSAMTVGKDHMGALSNTLIFAYVGASLTLLLQYTQFGGSWLKFINFDSVVEEIIRSLTGTIGIAFTVPITALLSAWIVMHGGPLASTASEHEHLHHHG